MAGQEDSKDLNKGDNKLTHISMTIPARLKLFFALSRTPHGLLDMATPAFAALLWLGTLPPFSISVLGILTAFAGYTAVYALNDIVDFQADKTKMKVDPVDESENYLDSVGARHPMATGLLSFREGLTWALGWSIVAMIGAWLLNPVCLLIFISGVVLEIVYCLMWRISPLRSLVSGAVKTSGAMAAVFAVDASPSPAFLIILFFCLFFWEIGGQNIPADWTDVDIDHRFNARTIPVSLGLDISAFIMLTCIIAVLLLIPLLFHLSGLPFGAGYILLSLGFSVYILLLPALKQFRERDRIHAMVLFNKASFFPPSLLLVVVLKVIF